MRASESGKTVIAVRHFIALLVGVSLLGGFGSDTETADMTSQSVTAQVGAAITDDAARMKWVIADGPAELSREMAPAEVIAITGEPSVRDMSDAEINNGKTETLTCWLYDHPDNPTEQDRSRQVCFRVNPKRGGRLYWVKRRTGASE